MEQQRFRIVDVLVPSIVLAEAKQKSNEPYAKVDVVVEGNKIISVTEHSPEASHKFEGEIIDGKNKMLLPG